MIQLICFSRNRPLQLDGYLTSLSRMLDEPSLLDVSVIVRADGEYRDAYAEVARAHPSVAMVAQKDFHADLTALVGARPFTCFGCDDVVFVRRFAARAIADAFDERLFAFSLRLGRHVTRSMFSGPISPPPGLEERDGLLRWDLSTAHGAGDWGYSWELCGTVYPTELARAVIAELRAPSPNLLEAGGGGRWSSKTARRFMCAWPSARLVVPTVNVVQGDFANPVLGGRSLEPRFLLDCWQRGLRLDVEAFARREYDCIHVPDFFLRRA
ncbi:MAG TPA: hypothetical protein VFF06_29955 [Polyangia bacterium]|nr:hypothetical protein [Polyangia bacterium]